jgi:DNA-binding transcriptional regulator YhcF (GntR family)
LHPAYYDAGPGQARSWLASARAVAGVVGIMYTTWRQAYQDLEAFAAACKE